MRALYMASLGGEIVLKSERTRPRFERRLVSNIEHAFMRNNIKYDKVWIKQARLFVEGEDEKIPSILRRVFGIYSVMRVFEVEFKDLGDLASKIESIASSWVENKLFAVRVKRTGSHDFTSMDAARLIGEKLYPYSRGVDLERPEVVVYVEIRGNKAYVYREKLSGPGGLPIGVEGKALVLFSGGFDSPVAAWLTAKRGVEVYFIHYFLSPQEPIEEIVDIARTLSEKWLYGYTPTLYIVDFTPIIAKILSIVRKDYAQIVLRAAMYVYADRFAVEKSFDGLVTGESIGQVASQTLRNLKALSIAVKTELPILRPLLGLDKEEIINYSRSIGLYELSSKIREYCSLSGAPTTRADPSVLRREYEKIKEVLEEVQVVGEYKF